MQEEGTGKPVATILRYVAENQSQEHQYLVVTKLGDNEACHMAHIDATLPNHNELAREAADQFAPTFDCRRDRLFSYSGQGQDYDDNLGTAPCTN